LRSLQEIQPDFVEEAKPKLSCGAKERRRTTWNKRKSRIFYRKILFLENQKK
jgi:hypothetical protein